MRAALKPVGHELEPAKQPPATAWPQPQHGEVAPQCMALKAKAKALLIGLQRQLTRYQSAFAHIKQVGRRGQVRSFYQQRVALLRQPMMRQFGQYPMRQNRVHIPGNRSLLEQSQMLTCVCANGLPKNKMK